MAYCKIMTIKRGLRSAGQTIQKTADYVILSKKTTVRSKGRPKGRPKVDARTPIK